MVRPSLFLYDMLRKSGVTLMVNLENKENLFTHNFINNFICHIHYKSIILQSQNSKLFSNRWYNKNPFQSRLKRFNNQSSSEIINEEDDSSHTDLDLNISIANKIDTNTLSKTLTKEYKFLRGSFSNKESFNDYKYLKNFTLQKSKQIKKDIKGFSLNYWSKNYKGFYQNYILTNSPYIEYIWEHKDLFLFAIDRVQKSIAYRKVLQCYKNIELYSNWQSEALLAILNNNYPPSFKYIPFNFIPKDSTVVASSLLRYFKDPDQDNYFLNTKDPIKERKENKLFDQRVTSNIESVLSYLKDDTELSNDLISDLSRLNKANVPQEQLKVEELNNVDLLDEDFYQLINLIHNTVKNYLSQPASKQNNISFYQAISEINFLDKDFYELVSCLKRIIKTNINNLNSSCSESFYTWELINEQYFHIPNMANENIYYYNITRSSLSSTSQKADLYHKNKISNNTAFASLYSFSINKALTKEPDLSFSNLTRNIKKESSQEELPANLYYIEDFLTFLYQSISSNLEIYDLKSYREKLYQEIIINLIKSLYRSNSQKTALNQDTKTQFYSSILKASIAFTSHSNNFLKEFNNIIQELYLFANQADINIVLNLNLFQLSKVSGILGKEIWLSMNRGYTNTLRFTFNKEANLNQEAYTNIWFFNNEDLAQLKKGKYLKNPYCDFNILIEQTDKPKMLKAKYNYLTKHISCSWNK